MQQNFESYKEKLKDGRKVYYRGKLVKDVTTHPFLSLEVNQVRYFFQKKYYFEDDNKSLISKFYKTPKSSADLLERSQITYEVTKEAGVLSPHIGSDAFNALSISTYSLDGKFHSRFLDYRDYVVKSDLLLAVAQIDVKGDRVLRPTEQKDPDMYVHVVDEDDKGIRVSGAKMHTTWAAVANEILVLPGRSFKQGEEDYAICFAIPANAKGLTLISRPAIESESVLNKMEGPRSSRAREGETLTVLDNVFVPWERVFLYKDVKQASGLALLFALWHRLSAVSYRAALAEYLIGLGKLVAEANGLDKISHIQKNITDIISFCEIQRMCARMAAYECRIDKKTGIAVPNQIYTNVGKLYSNEAFINILKSLIDVAGGAAITIPSADDYSNVELKPIIDKYMSAAVPGDQRFKLLLAIREVIALLGGLEAVLHIHAEGSMEASRIELYRSYDYTEAKLLIADLLSTMK